MPRPKRTKVASSAPISRVANTAPATNIPSKDQDIPNQSTRRVASTSEDSEGIVTTSATLRNRRGVEKRDVFMSGGLATGDAQDAHRKPGATRRRVAAVDTARALEQVKAIEGLKKRREAVLTKQKVSVVEVPSSIPASGAEDEAPPAIQSPEAIRREERVSPGTGFRARETPRAETSVLALANFRRRPRQPSILQVPIQQGVDATFDDLYDATDPEEDNKIADEQIGHLQPEDETETEAQGSPRADMSILSLAHFKRRPRQPSILQVAIQQGISNGDDRDLYEDDDDVEQPGAFQPEDESTPLIVSKTKSQVEAVLSSSLSSPTPEPLPGSSSKKRKLTPVEVQVPRSSPPAAPSSPSPDDQPNESYSSPAVRDEEREPSSEQQEAHLEREVTPQIWSDTLAPPLSSSPSQPTPHSTSPPVQSTRPTTAPPKRNHPSRNTHQSKTNKSPTKPSNLAANPRLGTRTRQPLSTATLQTLLPRRRTRARPSTFDIPSSDSIDAQDEPSSPVDNDDDDDDDELSHQPTKKLSARKRVPNTALAIAARVGKKHSPVKKQRGTATAKKAAAAPAVAGPSAKMKTTYTRRAAAEKDKENAEPDAGISEDGAREEGDAEGGREGDGRIRIGGKELERAARWFREVARWELEFEDVTGSSDSMMRDAR